MAKVLPIYEKHYNDELQCSNKRYVSHVYFPFCLTEQKDGSYFHGYRLHEQLQAKVSRPETQRSEFERSEGPCQVPHRLVGQASA